MSVKRYPEACSLQLADGQRWRIVGTDGTMGLVMKMCTILGLSIYEGIVDRQIIFIRREPGKDTKINLDLQSYPGYKDYPATGWLLVDSGPVRIWQHSEVQDVICEVLEAEIDHVNLVSIIHSLFPLYQYVIERGGLPFHAAMVELNGKGAVIVARSGTGKSTCFTRIDRPWRAVSDEEALAVKVADGYVMHPMPTWKHFLERGQDEITDIQRQIPLSAIFFLEHGSTDEVIPIGKGKSAISIYQSSTQMCHKFLASMDRNQVSLLNKKLFDNACQMSTNVPTYILRATLTGRFWDAMEKVMPCDR